MDKLETICNELETLKSAVAEQEGVETYNVKLERVLPKGNYFDHGFGIWFLVTKNMNTNDVFSQKLEVEKINYLYNRKINSHIKESMANITYRIKINVNTISKYI